MDEKRLYVDLHVIQAVLRQPYMAVLQEPGFLLRLGNML